MNKFKAVIGMIWAMSVTIMIGCVEEFDAGVKGMPAEGLVVEGNIVSDSAVVFQLSKTMPLTNSKRFRSAVLEASLLLTSASP